MRKILQSKIDGRKMDDSEIIESILSNRGIDDIVSFLHPVEDDMIDFKELKGIDEAAKILLDAIDNNKTILIYYDSDVDGSTSGSIAYRYLKNYTDNIRTYIAKGKMHGLEGLPLTELDDVNVLWIVDSINDDAKLYQDILDKGVQIIITDHHIIPRKLIDSKVEINLVSSANDYKNPDLTGAGVTWKLCAYLDYLTLNDFSESLYDLCCTGIIADMGSMQSSENRFLCYKGLNNLRNPAIKKLIGSYDFDSQSVQFSVAPVVNALVRTNNNDIAMKIFTTDDDREINELINIAKGAKEQQNEDVNSIIDELIVQGECQLDRKCKVFWIPEEYRNLSGLLGNKLANIFQSPVLIVHLNEGNTLITGSMRSVGTDDFAAMINGTGLALAKGHENASGFECEEDMFDMFTIVIEEQLKDIEFCTKIEADIELLPSQINENLVKQLAALNRISGTGWAPIKVLLRTDDYEVSTFSSFKHLKIIDNQTGVLIVKWNTDEFKTMDNNGTVVAVGTLSNPRYGRNRFLQLTIDDFTKQND